MFGTGQTTVPEITFKAEWFSENTFRQISILDYNS